MPRFVPRRFLVDAALALALLALTLGPGAGTGLLVDGKPGLGLLERLGVPVDAPWWLFAGLVLAGVLLRQQRPVAALVLATAGTAGHLVLQTKLQLLDLALPLVLYTVATVARRRRTALALLGVTMLLTYAAMLTGRADVQRREAKLSGKQAAPVAGHRFSADALADAGQAVLEMWLLLAVAVAAGDGMRSRRAHLAAVEQRTADLAREERQRAALAVAAERARITRELHDVVAHGMSVMVVQAQGAAAALDRHPDRTATALRHVIETGRSSLAEMRRLLAAGRGDTAGDPELAPLPGIGAVPALVDRSRSAGMRVELHVEGVPAAVPATVDLSAYRIVQEALTNTLKHGGPGAGARVRLAFGAERLLVEVADDGRGPAEGADGRGNGLRGIAERVSMLGGDLAAGRDPGGGFRVTATLPLTVRDPLAADR
ncbi:two-component sensor histidine kinase [Paractinoplanes deccanensis]|uniref:histidine kinase n=1 Tax=Paractinoplanes deccanensis TaxID=113561 RepID=A0ABQ3Y4P7_9ACTN|nr:histidine kinase [Actinoplanes deccanensis]GID74971.1 two-component sensor histidine kinase [Actinoplanes deccanensis]